MAEVVFHVGDEQRRVVVPEGVTILDAARRGGILMESPCDGHGICGKCKVRVVGSMLWNLEDAGVAAHLTIEELAKGYLLACHSVVLHDLQVEVIERKDNRNVNTISDGRQLSIPLDGYITKRYSPSDGRTSVLAGDVLLGTEVGNTAWDNYGVVVDIGTTTLVAALFHISSGRELASTTALNPQGHYAQDVLSRIKYASTVGGLSLMHGTLMEALDGMISTVTSQAGVARDHIYEVVFSGNTCMLHLATKVDPAPLGKHPYTPAISAGRSLPAVDCGLTLSPLAQVYLPPIISGYVGADITSGILAARLPHCPGLTLFVDIGTNGEMVLADDGVLVAASTAAGPAFEGMNISCGMRAAPGAIERFEIHDGGEISFTTIGGVEAEGICGSGLLDAVGELTRCGIIQPNGRLSPTGRRSAIDSRLVKRDGRMSFQITDRVHLSQRDVRQVQLAKGAIRAGIEALLARNRVSSEAVDRVLIAGAFGYHLNPESLINIGLLPVEFRDKIEFLGNTSKTGGQAFLLNRAVRREMADVVKRVAVLDLAMMDQFDQLFVDCLSFA